MHKQYKRHKNPKIFKRGDIYWAYIPETSENVYCGKHPVLIVSNNIENKYNSVVIVCPLTTKIKPHRPTHVYVEVDEPSTVICEQVNSLNKRCLRGLLGLLSPRKMREIDEALMISLGLDG